MHLSYWRFDTWCCKRCNRWATTWLAQVREYNRMMWVYSPELNEERKEIKNAANAWGKEHAQVLLGRSYLNRGLHPESNWRKSVGTWIVFRKEAEPTTRDDIREHCLCARGRSEAKEAGPEVWEVRIGRLLIWTQWGYKCYNPQTKQVRVSRDVVFDKTASWYLPSTRTPNSIPISEDEVSKAKIPLDKGDIGSLEESLISFRLSGPNETPSQND